MKKVKNKNGSTFIFVLFLLALVGIMVTVLYSYIIIQTKVSMKTNTNTKDLYIAQGGIERVVADFISTIEIDPPTNEAVETEIPNYIAAGTITRRIGRNIRALVGEIGIINGNFKYNKNNNKLDADENNDENNWLDPIIGSQMNKSENDGILVDLDRFNTKTWYVDSEQSTNNGIPDSNKWIKNVDDLKSSINDLNSIKETVLSIKNRIKQIKDGNYHGTKLKIEQIKFIEKNILIIDELILEIENVIDKQKDSGFYNDYEYFITPTNKHASNLDETIDNILLREMSSLKKLIEQSVKSINAMPNLIENINDVTNDDGKSVWQPLKKMTSNLSANKQAMLDGIRLDLERAKDASNDEEKLKFVVSASIKLNKLVVIIGEVNTEKSIIYISNHANNNINQNYDNGVTDDKLGFTRANILNARTSTKAAQIECDYIQYKLSKSILNLYKNTITINNKDVAGILQYSYINLNDIKINKKVNGKYKEFKLPDTVFNKINIVSEKIIELNNISKHTNQNPYTLEVYDKKIKEIITISKDNKNELSLLIQELEEILNDIVNSDNKNYNVINDDAEIKLSNVINNLKNIEVVLNGLVLDNEYITTSFNTYSNVNVRFKNDVSISEHINEISNSDNSFILGTAIESINAKIKQPNLDSEGVDVSPSDVDKEVISLNPNRNLEFKLILESNVTSSKRSRLKVNANVYINNVRIKTDGNKPISVDYEIDYKIKGMSKSEL